MEAYTGEWIGFCLIEEEESGFLYVHLKFDCLKKVQDEQACVFQCARNSLGVFVCTAHCDIVCVSYDENRKMKLQTEEVVDENDPKECRRYTSLWAANFHIEIF